MKGSWNQTLQTPISMIPKFQHVYMIGIGGSGMCGIAEILLKLGFRVSGSDQNESLQTHRLREQGATIHKGHDASHLDESIDVVVYSSAISWEHVEMQAAKDLKLLTIRRAEMLSELIRFGFGIAVAGTHGKSSTTSMIAAIFDEAGLDPTFVVGGRVRRSKGDRSHGTLGKSRYFIVEADESDASFRHINPILTVVTNIDADHMSTYQNSLENLRMAFKDFLYNIPFYGKAVVCYDDANVRMVVEDLNRHVVRYGFGEDCDYCAFNLKASGTSMSFSVRFPDASVHAFKLRVPGKHNVLNATAAIAIAIEEGIAIESIAKALEDFRSVGRRFDVYQAQSYTVVDDYGHHPSEIKATVEAARDAFADRRLVMAFQPHRYSRTKLLFEELVQALEKADMVIVGHTYSAGEAPLEGFLSQDLCAELRARGQVSVHYAESHAQMISLLQSKTMDDDVVIVQGAGDIGQMVVPIQKALAPQGDYHDQTAH